MTFLGRRASRGALVVLAAPLLAAALLVSACSDRTSILVRITSATLETPAELDTLELSIRGATTGMVVDRTFMVANGWPQTLSIRPGPMESESVEITVRGRRGATLVDEEIVSASFVAGAEVVVEVMLGEGAPPDGGSFDGGRPDGGDGGSVDGGPDAGPLDAGCSSDESCDDGVACTRDTCMSGGCVHAPDDALCATGSTCDPVAGCPPRACANDTDCDDGRYCNGAETCDTVATACVAGASPCDDTIACTDDACDEPSDTCAHSTRDADMDGAGDATCPAMGGVPATDCDDLDAAVNPGAPDVCDGVDNDCSGTCDSSSTCCRSASEGCTTTCGTTGSRTCGSACSWSVCSPPPELCNGMDDDCNGACDDGIGCCAGSTSACATTCGSTGTQTCGADCTAGTCAPPLETCNGSDDDCDMQIDEGFSCGLGMTRACTTGCGSTGIQSCSATCGWNTCMPPVEACNGIDDNCDGTTDEGCGACSGCPGTTTVSGAGGRYMVSLAASSHVGSCGGGTGNEGSLTFTITSVSDVFITTHASAVDTVLYVRGCTCSGSEISCNDNADGLTSSALHLTDLAAGTYHVFVDSKVATTRTVPVDVYISNPGMPSDRCGDPSFIPAGSAVISGTTCGYANDYDLNLVAGAANCEFGGSGNAEDRVYYFYLPTSRSVTISGCNAATIYDSSIYLRTVCSDNAPPAQVACNEDGCGGSRSCDRAYRSSRTVTMGPGLFYLFLDGYNGGTSSSTCPCGPFGFDLTGL